VDESGGRGRKWGAVSFQRRRFPRIDITLPVEYAVLSEEAGSSPGRTVTAHNISGGGLLLILPEFHPETTRLKLKIHLPGVVTDGPPTLSIETEVTVAWTEIRTGLERNEYRCGVSFGRVDERDIEAIRTFVRGQMESCAPKEENT
jgi:c-di-GMP-binding flagellar brake protein YcgR